ncbi:ABC transporter substrate-binding protein [Nitratireductor aquimarinus]|uniref:ABC transporter substrate-binding protein n=1 Tax=Nitratireductor aquimarinus TaxID=889300 RepID=A0ABU4AM80_9HYPH|nr:ABC transporter substrate-binding protein [Nitratireductor aquimarinus]MDV6227348.1 ABC transporter substrate-binding protein [Nitratireductor aquimarinus]
MMNLTLSRRVFLAGATALSVLAGGSTATLAAAPADTLVIAKPADPQSLDPAVTMDNNDWTVTYPAYQRLMKYETKDGKGLTSVTGDLADSWEASEDGLTWTFKLKDGQKFDDGTAVDANAVKFSFDRLFRIGQGPSEALPSGVEVTVVDPMTVSFKLSETYAPFLYALANNGAAIVNPKIAEQGDDDGKAYLASNTAGSGPYRLANWERGQTITMEPNPHYGGDKPAIDKMRIVIIGEASARRLQLEAGDVDIAEALPEDQLEALESKDGIAVQNYPSLRVTYLYMNNQKAPLDNADVRRAISYAVDYEGLIDGILNGNGKQMHGPIPDGMWGRDESVIQYNRNVDKAKELLASAGADGAEITFLYSDVDPNWEPIAIATQANLAEIGLNVKLEKLANATMRERFDTGDFGMATGNWTPDFADPYMFTSYWFDSDRHGLAGNRSWYTNEKVDELLRKAALSSDQAEREKLYAEVQKIVTDEAAYVYLFQKDYRIAMRDNVEGFVFNPMLLDIYNIAGMSK